MHLYLKEDFQSIGPLLKSPLVAPTATAIGRGGAGDWGGVCSVNALGGVGGDGGGEVLKNA